MAFVGKPEAPRPRTHASGHAPGPLLINANENPLGPCKASYEASAAVAPKGGRYDIDGETDKLTKSFAAQNGLKKEYITVYAGSSEPLHSVSAVSSPSVVTLRMILPAKAGMRALS